MAIVEECLLISILDHSKGAILSTSMIIIIRELTVFVGLTLSEALQKTNSVSLVELRYNIKKWTILSTGRHVKQLHALQI